MDAKNRLIRKKKSLFRGHILIPYWKVDHFYWTHDKFLEEVVCLASRLVLFLFAKRRFPSFSEEDRTAVKKYECSHSRQPTPIIALPKNRPDLLCSHKDAVLILGRWVGGVLDKLQATPRVISSTRNLRRDWYAYHIPVCRQNLVLLLSSNRSAKNHVSTNESNCGC